ncbi:MAG: hypothetical protein DMF82_11290, partial [Acidobacteria bacterium]
MAPELLRAEDVTAFTYNHPMLSRLAGSALVVLIAFAAGPGPASLAPMELRCDGMADPLGVDSSPPRLSWQLRGDGQGLRQTAGQVLVSSSLEVLGRDQGDVWDSGRVETDEQLHVPYRGRALRSAEQVFWKVRVWDADGRASAWSTPARWTMGLLDAGDWHARWITDPDLRRWSRPLLGYHSQDGDTAEAVKWIQIDLGSARRIDELRFHALRHTVPERLGFPRRFRVELANRADLTDATMVADETARDYGRWTVELKVPITAVTARYVRLTATRLSERDGKACLALSQVEVVSGGKNVAVGAQVTASDSLEQPPWSAAALTDGLGAPDANPRANGTLLLRREFDVRAGLRRGLASVCGLGQYEMSVNGARVGTGLLTPAWTAYDKSCLYDTYDVTPLLRAGSNAVGMVL